MPYVGVLCDRALPCGLATYISISLSPGLPTCSSISHHSLSPRLPPIHFPPPSASQGLRFQALATMASFQDALPKTPTQCSQVPSTLRLSLSCWLVPPSPICHLLLSPWIYKPRVAYISGVQGAGLGQIKDLTKGKWDRSA